MNRNSDSTKWPSRSRVRGTDGIQFTKGRNQGIEVVSWDEFRETLEKRRLQVYESSGCSKIMRKRR